MFGPVDPRRIPVIGHDIYQVGQVYNIASQPCGPDPWIAVQAFWSYAPHLLWSLVKPDWGDLNFNRQGRRHRRIRKRSFRLDGSMSAPAPKSPGVSMALFTGYQLAQRVGWYLLVADAVTDFAVNWTSMAYQWSGCDVSGMPWGRASGAHGYVGGSSTPWATWWKAPETSWFSPGYATDSTWHINAAGPKTFMVSATIEIHESANHPGRMTGAYIVRTQTGFPTRYIPIAGGGAGPGVHAIQGVDTILDATAGAARWSVRLEFEGGRCTFLDGKASASGAPAAGTGLLHDP